MIAARTLLARLLARYPVGPGEPHHALTVNTAGELVVMLNLPGGWCDVVLEEPDLALGDDELFAAIGDAALNGG